MEWALILFLSVKINEPVGGIIVAKYGTIEECDNVARKMRQTYLDTRSGSYFRHLAKNTPDYECTPVPKQ